MDRPAIGSYDGDGVTVHQINAIKSSVVSFNNSDMYNIEVATCGNTVHPSLYDELPRLDSNSIVNVGDYLLVKVIAKILYGLTPTSSIKYAILVVKTFVFPLPAPANIKIGPSVVKTASFCSLFNSLMFILSTYLLKVL